MYQNRCTFIIFLVFLLTFMACDCRNVGCVGLNSSTEEDKLNILSKHYSGWPAGCRLKVSVSLSDTLAVYKTHLMNGSYRNVDGLSTVAYAYIIDLMDILNFTIEIIPSAGSIAEGPNKTIRGIGLQVATGEADIGIDIHKPVVYRVVYLTFLHAIRQDRVVIMFRQPVIQLYRNVLFRPFHLHLWIVFVTTWLALMGFAAAAAAWRKFEDFDFEAWRTRRSNGTSVLLLVTANVLGRCMAFGPLLRGSNKPLKLIFLISSMFGLTMYSIYSAIIVSSLRVHDPPIKSFQDLIKHQYQFQAQPTLPAFTRVYVNDPRLGMYYAAKARRNFVSVDNAVSRLFTENPWEGGGIAWFVLKSDFYYYALRSGYSSLEICKITPLEPELEPEHPRPLAMYVAKNNTFLKEAFNRRILDILERGLGKRHVERFEREFQPKCDPFVHTASHKYQKIRVYDVYAAYYLLIFGSILAVFVLCCEVAQRIYFKSRFGQ